MTNCETPTEHDLRMKLLDGGGSMQAGMMQRNCISNSDQSPPSVWYGIAPLLVLIGVALASLIYRKIRITRMTRNASRTDKRT